MKRAIAIIASLLFVFVLTSVSFAYKLGAKDVEAKETVKKVTGEVAAVDTKAMTITISKKVEGKAVETVVTVDDKTKVMMGKEKKALSDVKVGNKVTVKYTEVDGKNVAKSVAIAPEKKAKGEPKGAKHMAY